MNYEIEEKGKFRYISTKGGDQVLLLLHGLFGALSNYKDIIERFGDIYNVVVPMLPMYELPLRKVSLGGLLEHLIDFVAFFNFKNVHVLGNSLGGHLALLYTLKKQENVRSLILTGSSGLFENALGNSFPPRGNKDYVRKKTQSTFYDPSVATEELIDEVYETVNNRNKVIRIIATAKSAIRHNVGDKLEEIKVPVLLIWGKQDNITPLFVGERFNKSLINSQLRVVEKCGHAPMMEKPEEFNDILEEFLLAVDGD